MPNTWVVVADSAAARLFLAPSPTGPLEEFESYAHGEGRMHARDLVTGEQGRSFVGVGAGRHALEPRADPKEQEKIGFARLIAERVCSARAKGELNRVFLIAPPEFLGHLRANLDSESKRMVEGEYGLNVVRLKPEQIRAKLPERLYSVVNGR